MTTTMTPGSIKPMVAMVRQVMVSRPKSRKVMRSVKRSVAETIGITATTSPLTLGNLSSTGRCRIARCGGYANRYRCMLGPRCSNDPVRSGNPLQTVAFASPGEMPTPLAPPYR